MITMRPALLLVLCSATLQAAEARTMHVRTWGADDATCGSVRSPCRSIVHALAAASARDRVIVGPGEYVGTAVLDKVGVRLESTAGARVTTIRGDGMNVAGVLMLADRTVLG